MRKRKLKKRLAKLVYRAYGVTSATRVQCWCRPATKEEEEHTQECRAMRVAVKSAEEVIFRD